MIKEYIFVIVSIVNGTLFAGKEQHTIQVLVRTLPIVSDRFVDQLIKIKISVEVNEKGEVDIQDLLNTSIEAVRNEGIDKSFVGYLYLALADGRDSYKTSGLFPVDHIRNRSFKTRPLLIESGLLRPND
jgi:hypothetical protein